MTTTDEIQALRGKIRMNKGGFNIPWEGKKTLEEEERKTGKEGRNFSEMTTKIEDTIIKWKANISTAITEKVNRFDASLLQPLLGKIA